MPSCKCAYARTSAAIVSLQRLLQGDIYGLVHARRLSDAPEPSASAVSPSPAEPTGSTDPAFPGAKFTYVYTVDELKRACEGGAKDVEIRSHLDLSSLQRARMPGFPNGSISTVRASLLYSSANLRSIRVRLARGLLHCKTVSDQSLACGERGHFALSHPPTVCGCP